MRPRKILTERDARTLISLGLSFAALLPISRGARLATALIGVGLTATTLAPRTDGRSRADEPEPEEATTSEEMALSGLASGLPGGYVVPPRRLRAPRVVLV